MNHEKPHCISTTVSVLRDLRGGVVCAPVVRVCASVVRGREMKTPHKEKRRLPHRWADSRPEFSLSEYQFIEAAVVCAKFGHNRALCQGECEICTSMNRLRTRIGRHRLQSIMMAIADRLGLKHE